MGWPTYELAQDFFRKPNWLAPKVSPTKTNDTVRPYYRTLVVDNFLRGVRSLPLRSVRSWACFLKSSTSIVWRTSKLGIEKNTWMAWQPSWQKSQPQKCIHETILSASIHLHPSCFGAEVHIFRRCPCCPHQVQWQLAWGQDALVSSNNVAVGRSSPPGVYIYINVVISKIYIYSNMLFLTGTTLSILMHFVVNLSISTNAFVAFSPTLEALLLSDVQIHRSKGMPCF